MLRYTDDPTPSFRLGPRLRISTFDRLFQTLRVEGPKGSGGVTRHATPAPVSSAVQATQPLLPLLHSLVLTRSPGGVGGSSLRTLYPGT